jgi:hypothetical protein
VKLKNWLASSRQAASCVRGEFGFDGRTEAARDGKIGAAAMRNFLRITSFFLTLVFLAAGSFARTDGPEALSVWFMPTSYSPDINDLFSYPNQWPKARALVDALVFSPSHIEGQHSLLSGLLAVDAFRRPKAWGIDTVLVVPSLKEWDCAASHTDAISVRIMKKIFAAGGSIQFLEMDEPLLSALGLNTPVCHLGVDTAAQEVAHYANSVTNDSSVRESGSVPKIIDIEPYPALSVAQMEAWLIALENHGFKPAGLNLDPNARFIDTHAEIKARFAGDLCDLRDFLRKHEISFGIIIWSGYDPLRNDKEYYDHAMDLAHTIHMAIGRPDRVVFKSWVKRCSLTEPCKGPNIKCASTDPMYCGTMSIPLNLPEHGTGVFSHTRLIKDATSILVGP